MNEYWIVINEKWKAINEWGRVPLFIKIFHQMKILAQNEEKKEDRRRRIAKERKSRNADQKWRRTQGR